MAALSWEVRNQTVAATYGIGKSRAVTTSRKGFVLDFLGITEVPWEDVEKEVAMFTIAAYNGSGMTMSECHKWLWAQKIARSYAAPKLASLQPTTEGFLQNAKRAHFQVTQWYSNQMLCLSTTRLWLGSWWHQPRCSRRSVRGTRLRSEAHLLWLWLRNAMQERELWLHRSPNSMYNILCLWSWSLVFEQANYCQSSWWQSRRCRQCRGRQMIVGRSLLRRVASISRILIRRLPVPDLSIHSYLFCTSICCSTTGFTQFCQLHTHTSL